MADNIKKVIEDDGTIHYYLGDLHHNPDGPAVIGFAGRHKEYWFKGLRHRIDGPAIEYASGDKYWYINGELHREDGPAIEDANGDKYWFINGELLTETEFNQRTESCNNKIVEIDGKKYKLTQI